jgi:hypothetical protein
MIFCDAALGMIHVEPQVTLNATDTILAKDSFERMALQAGVTIKSYHADHGVYTVNALSMKSTLTFNQFATVVLAPTGRTEWLREPSDTLYLALALSCSTRYGTGRRWKMPLSGRWPWHMLCTFTTTLPMN